MKFNLARFERYISTSVAIVFVTSAVTVLLGLPSSFFLLMLGIFILVGFASMFIVTHLKSRRDHPELSGMEAVKTWLLENF